MLRRITIIVALIATAAVQSRAGSRLFPISRQAVRDAIVMRFGDSDLSELMSWGDAMRLAVNPLARTESPKLVPDAMEPAVDRGTTYLRMRCQPLSDCIPFMVELRLPSELAQNLQRALSKRRSYLASPIVLRAGSHPVLLLSRGDLRISLPVRALQSGRSGERIRVSSADTGKLYWARVVSATQVEGSF